MVDDSDPSGFSESWLSLREPFDSAARAPLLGPMLAATRRASLGANETARIVDLGSGTGATVRALAPVLGANQSWELYDSNGPLLDAARLALERWGVRSGYTVRSVAGELHLDQGEQQIRVAFYRFDANASLDDLPVRGAWLITASAFLDLVSAAWAKRLIVKSREAGCLVYFALSYDGRLVWSPSDPDDEMVRRSLNAHQLRDKGFGSALGPSAPAQISNLLVSGGYGVQVGRSDWRAVTRNSQPTGRARRRLQDFELQTQMIGDLAGVAEEVSPSDHPRWAAWATRRRAILGAGDSALTVGHWDHLGLL